MDLPWSLGVEGGVQCCMGFPWWNMCRSEVLVFRIEFH